MTKLVLPIDITLKKLEDLREDALFGDQDEDAAKYETEILLLRAAIRRGEQYQVNF